MTTAIIVQARIGSSRLPGKVIQDLAGRPVLEHVLRRCASIPGADVVVCAVPDQVESDVLEAIALKSGAVTFRGSELDVLSRYLGAAQSVEAHVVMRVTSDCPLIDPEICGEVLALRQQQGVDYAANNLPASFPHGLDCEAMTIDALHEANETAFEAGDREHVTPWLRRASEIRRANLFSGDRSLVRHRWTLDYPEDLAFFRSVFVSLPDSGLGRMADVLRVLEQKPSLCQINAMHVQRHVAHVEKR
jgi:spore coat polysaccharide biosynthesis protein SpsF